MDSPDFPVAMLEAVLHYGFVLGAAGRCRFDVTVLGLRLVAAFRCIQEANGATVLTAHRPSVVVPPYLYAG